MLTIRSQSHDAYFNLALEEYLFKQFSEPFFMLYRNERSVVVGKHQNALAEINHQFVNDHNIKVVRRLSGGGTVFHDMGNVNFMFIATGKTDQVVDFRKYMDPVREALLKLDLDVYYSKRNDLFIDGKKISGNAEHAVRKRVLHHGTLLFSAQLDALRGALNVHADRYFGRAVQSVRSTVTNINTYLKQELAIEAFMDRVEKEVQALHPNSQVYALTPTDIHAVEQLMEEKYKRWDWNFGYSPKYRFKNAWTPINGFEDIELAVEKGRLTEVSFEGNVLTTEMRTAFGDLLVGQRHRLTDIQRALEQCQPFVEAFPIANRMDFVKSLF
jgi:lipoate-protein ligase A